MDTLTKEIAAILFTHDPMIINFDENIGEYNLEAEEIVSLLNGDSCQQDIINILEFVMSKWFGKDWWKINRRITKKKMLTSLSEGIYTAKLKSKQ